MNRQLETDRSIIAWFAATRAVHFGACLLVLGVLVFDRFVVVAVPRREQGGIDARWRSIARVLLLLALPAALISGASWLVLVAIEMSGLPVREAVHADVLKLVWNETQFGGLWRLRAVVWLATAVVVLPLIVLRRHSVLRDVLAWLAVALGGLLAASLAWSGHGQTGGPLAWHLVADIVHILASGFWPTGLLPLALILWAMRKSTMPQKWDDLSLLVRRFSATSLVSVALLSASGLGNSWFLVGSLSNLIGTTYGKVLLLKVGVFCAMVAIGAVNLLYLKPRLSAPRSDASLDPAAGRLWLNVLTELALGTAVIIIVGIMGLLPPATESLHHHVHHSDDDASSATMFGTQPLDARLATTVANSFPSAV